MFLRFNSSTVAILHSKSDSIFFMHRILYSVLGVTVVFPNGRLPLSIYSMVVLTNDPYSFTHVEFNSISFLIYFFLTSDFWKNSSSSSLEAFSLRSRLCIQTGINLDIFFFQIYLIHNGDHATLYLRFVSILTGCDKYSASIFIYLCI